MPTSHGADTQKQAKSVTTPSMLTRYMSEGHHLKWKSVPVLDNVTGSLGNECLILHYKGNAIMGATYPETQDYEDFRMKLDKLVYELYDKASKYVMNNIIIPSLGKE